MFDGYAVVLQGILMARSLEGAQAQLGEADRAHAQIVRATAGDPDPPCINNLTESAKAGLVGHKGETTPAASAYNAIVQLSMASGRALGLLGVAKIGCTTHVNDLGWIGVSSG